jgi:hypothetical protein
MAAKTNLEHLQDLLKKNQTANDELVEFISSIEDDLSDIGRLRRELDILKEGEDTDDDEAVDSEIDCGIGVIKYISPDNLLLIDLMENLELSIKKHGALTVSNALKKLSNN